jgi:hypothetical protein
MPVAVRGLVETQRALRKFDPDLYKALQAEIRPELSGMAREAKSLVPKYYLSGAMSDGKERQSRTSRSRAFPTYDNAQIRRGLTYSMGRQKRQRNGWQSMYSLLNKSAMGAIIETAGRLHPAGDPASQSNNPNAGRAFIERANQISGLKQVGKGRKNQGRLAFAAVADNMGKAKAAIVDAIQRAEAKYRSATL